VFDYIRMFVQSFTEGDVELLLVLLQCMNRPIARSGVAVTQLLFFRYHTKMYQVPHAAKCGRHSVVHFVLKIKMDTFLACGASVHFCMVTET
jgi:hypothetical protein